MEKHQPIFVSIIIPMRNEEKFVAECLDSLLYQIKGHEDIEILCVDGISTDKTCDIVQQYASKDKRVRLIKNLKKIAPTAMNLGIAQSRGDFIMVAGCHAKYACDYIDKCLEVLQRTGAEHAGGYMTTIPGKNSPIGRSIAAATSCWFGVGNAMFRLCGPEREVDTVPFGMYRKTVFEKIGLYDERLVRNQDIELNSRIRKAGGRIIISPQIKLYYYSRVSFLGLWQQSFNNGLWNPYTIWLIGGGLSFRHFIPMFFVTVLVALTVASFFWWPLVWLLLGYVIFYLSVASFFAIRRARQTKNSAFLVLFSFIVLHIAYGLGSLWSVATIPFKFPHRKKRFVGEPLADRRV
jgi:glycosyltransferase involved in cell wall biosynthesis